MAIHIKQLEAEIHELRMKLTTTVTSSGGGGGSKVTETYKVKSFEIAAKLALSDGDDDGLYKGLPIEIEGEGLYRDLVASGRKSLGATAFATAGSGHKSGSLTSTHETYKVETFEMAEKLAKMDGTDDGLYRGIPIEVTGQGLYRDLVRQGVKSQATVSSKTVSSSSSSSGTYKVSSMEMAAKISKMGGADDGTYKGLPIEVQGMGLYSDLLKK